MYKTQNEILWLFFALLCLLTGCGGENWKIGTHAECNSMYYWKTVYRLSESEKAFLQKQRVKRLYVRFFDVVEDVNQLTSKWDAVPNATIRFQERPDSLLEIVPTIYITLDALKRMEDSEGEYAAKIVERVGAMVNANHIQHVKEVQLDCDWTRSTENIYFNLCREVRKQFHHKSISVSATIRLHQLHQEEPPVDRGVLMLYNTGNIRDYGTENSILSYKDVQSYLKRRNTYGLHLDFAYPVFGWGVWFQERSFRAIIDAKMLSGLLQNPFVRVKDSFRYVVSEDFYDAKSAFSFKKGDIIRVERVSFREMKQVKECVERQLGGAPHSSILYHLDSLNLFNYSDDEIKSVFRVD